MLQKLKRTPYTTEEIKPEGWLKRQLEIEAEGLAGNLDKVWPDVRDSRWIGGDKEGWERVPYWLDGFIPLAYLLDDGEMKARAKRYIDAILAGQKEDGWICPCADDERDRYDVWAAFLLCKVLVVYYDCSRDGRVEDAVYRALKNLNRHMEFKTLFDWGAARWFECLIPLAWLYERRPEEWMEELWEKLRMEGLDYRMAFSHWRFQKPYAKYRWTFMTHVVNMGMVLKSEPLYARMGGDMEKANAEAKEMLRLLLRDHGMPTGHFTGDECLSGTSPIQGSELCSVVEAMYSYEVLFSLTGDPFWSDQLERLAFNALPAATSPDMWTHQYDQMTNQVQCSRIPEGRQPFLTNSGESHLFGLEPNYGCCTANFGQGWPKFALSALMAAEDGVAVAAIAPVSLETEINGVPVRVEIKGMYPFRDGYTVSVCTESPVEFALYLRIPGFAGGAAVDGQAVPTGREYRLCRRWEGAAGVSVRLDMEAKLVKRPGGMYCADRGPLLFSLPVEARWEKLEYVRDGVERKAPYCDYELYPTSKWNYGFAGEKFSVGFGEIGEYPFAPETAPIWLEAAMAEIPWEMEDGICAPLPGEGALGDPVTRRLLPYGCTNLRMTEMPKAGGLR